MDILKFSSRGEKFTLTKMCTSISFLLRQPTPTIKTLFLQKVVCLLWEENIVSPDQKQWCCKLRDLAGLPWRVSVETIICQHCIQHYSVPWKALMPINQKFYLNASNLFEERQSYSESDLSQHIPFILNSMSSVNTLFKII